MHQCTPKSSQPKAQQVAKLPTFQKPLHKDQDERNDDEPTQELVLNDARDQVAARPFHPRCS